MRIFFGLYAAFFCISEVNAQAASSEVTPTIEYQLEFNADGTMTLSRVGVDGERTVIRGDTSEVLSGDEMASKFAQERDRAKDQTGSVWILKDPNGRSEAVAPEGYIPLLDRMAPGYTLESVETSFGSWPWSKRPTLAEMEAAVQEQIGRAASAFKAEACRSMPDWNSLSFKFVVGASAIVEASMTVEGVFDPRANC